MHHSILSMANHIGSDEGTEFAKGVVNCSCGKVFSYTHDITEENYSFPFLTREAIRTAAEDFVTGKALDLFELHATGKV